MQLVKYILRIKNNVEWFIKQLIRFMKKTKITLNNPIFHIKDDQLHNLQIKKESNL